MRLRRLAEAAQATVAGDDGVEVSAVVHDSRAVEPGALFCCVPGRSSDGHDFAPTAVELGAVALLCQRLLPLPVPQLLVGDVRAALGAVAAAFHDHPSRRVDVVGVTGTNGKTTVVHLLRAALEADGRPTGVIGTLTGARTTPEAPELQATLAAMATEGRRAVAMEVSSHALALHRVDATWFSVAVFTNLGRDHLDFHHSVEDYFATKARLFEPERTAAAVVNLDDAHGRLLDDAAAVPTTGFSLDDAEGLEMAPAGSRFRWRGQPVDLPLGGRFNVSNALAAATAAVTLGADPKAVAAGLSAAEPVPGRFEVVDEGQPFAVVVDYAHTPDGLAEVIGAARGVAAGNRVLVVFGCGGDRDPTKRPAMGEVAARLADRVVLTSDNPRGEDPGTIATAVMQGMPRTDILTVELDRRAAIAAALAEAAAGDVVVIAGKGHETTQVVGERAIPFDDRQVARDELARMGGGGR